MIFVVLVLFTMLMFTHLHQSLDDEFPRRDCYESFSFPKVFIEFSQFAPAGPAYLFIIFEFNLYPVSNIDQEIIIIEKYYFKKIHRPCRSSLVFITKGIVFSKMNILIEIYFYRGKNTIADIFYTFGYGFIPGVYQLCDKNKYFGILIEILKKGNEHMMNVTHYPKAAKRYLKSLKKNNGYICVITGNNPYMIIKPIFKDGISHGLITKINIEYVDHNNLTDAFIYPAFEFFSDEINLEDSIIIVEDQSNIDRINFVASYMEYDKGYMIENKISFSLFNMSLKNIRCFVNFPENLHTQNITCQDGTPRMLFSSKHGITFYATEMKDVEIASNIFQLRRMVHSPLRPCTT